MLVPPEAMSGWKVTTVGDDIAWIKPDATGRLRAINPEAGVFGVAPGTSTEDQPERDGHDRAQHDLHERRAHAGRRRVVGGHDRRAARRVPRLARRALDAGDRASRRATGGASERPIHRARGAVPDHRPGLGVARRRADQRHHLRRAPRARRCRWSTRRSTGRRACTSARRWGRRRPRRRPAASATVRRDPMAMLPFCGYHMGDYFRHWIRMQRGAQRDPQDLPRELVPQGRGRAGSSGPASARTCACSSGSWTASTGACRRRKRRSAGCRATRTSTGGGLRFPREQFDELQTSRSGALAPGSHRARGAVHRAARPPAAGDDLRAGAVHLPVIGARACFAPRRGAHSLRTARKGLGAARLGRGRLTAFAGKGRGSLRSPAVGTSPRTARRGARLP